MPKPPRPRLKRLGLCIASSMSERIGDGYFATARALSVAETLMRGWMHGTPTTVATRPLLLLRDERLGHAVHQDGVCFALDELGS